MCWNLNRGPNEDYYRLAGRQHSHFDILVFTFTFALVLLCALAVPFIIIGCGRGPLCVWHCVCLPAYCTLKGLFMYNMARIPKEATSALRQALIKQSALFIRLCCCVGVWMFFIYFHFPAFALKINNCRWHNDNFHAIHCVKLAAISMRCNRGHNANDDDYIGHVTYVKLTWFITCLFEIIY